MIRVVAAILEHRGRLLICQRRRGDTFALQWEFPGGKVRRSESARAALTRELREELGIEVQVGRELFRARHRYRELADGLEIRFFAATRPFPTPRNRVFEQIVWARRSDLARYDFLPADRALVARLIRGEWRRDWTRGKESAAYSR